MARRVARFRVAGRFDGATTATVEVEFHGPDLAFFRVRPYKRRKTFELNLADVARGVVYDVTKQELATKRKARRRSP